MWSKKIGLQLLSLFRINTRIGRRADQLELPDNIRIHSVISVAYLKPATHPILNPYQRRRPPPSAVVTDGEEKYEVDRLVRKRCI